MRAVFLYSLSCVLFIAAGVLGAQLIFFVPAAMFGVLALSNAYYSGKGRMLSESELPKATYHVVYEVKSHGRTIVAIRTDKGAVLVCMSDGVGFTQFRLWGDDHRVLTPVTKTT